MGRRWSTALVAADDDCTSVVGWRLALSMITTEGIQGWYGRSSSNDGGVPGAPAGVGERLGVPPNGEFAAGGAGRGWAGFPPPPGDGVSRWPRGIGVAERQAGREGLERCGELEQLFRTRGGQRDGDGPAGLLARLLDDGESGVVCRSAAAVQPPRDGAGEEHVGRALAARERVSPAARRGPAVGGVATVGIERHCPVASPQGSLRTRYRPVVDLAINWANRDPSSWVQIHAHCSAYQLANSHTDRDVTTGIGTVTSQLRGAASRRG